MRNPETTGMKRDEVVFFVVLLAVMLLILPNLPLGKYGGGIAMVVVAVVGMIAYFVRFGSRLRSRGQLGFVIWVMALSTIAGAAVLLIQAPWR